MKKIYSILFIYILLILVSCNSPTTTGNNKDKTPVNLINIEKSLFIVLNENIRIELTKDNTDLTKETDVYHSQTGGIGIFGGEKLEDGTQYSLIISLFGKQEKIGEPRKALKKGFSKEDIDIIQVILNENNQNYNNISNTNKNENISFENTNERLKGIYKGTLINQRDSNKTLDIKVEFDFPFPEKELSNIGEKND